MTETDEARRARERAEDAHRDKINKIAGVGLLVLLLLVVAVYKMLIDQQAMQQCVESGRKNCDSMEVAPREGVRAPSR